MSTGVGGSGNRRSLRTRVPEAQWETDNRGESIVMVVVVVKVTTRVHM